LLGATFVALAAILAIMMAIGSSGSSSNVEAATTPSPYNCTVEPDKPCPDGNLSGVIDIHVGALPGSIYHCIARNDHDSSTNDLKIAASCSTEITGFGDSNAVPIEDIPGEGIDGTGGPPPPPGYTPLPPAKGIGKYLPTGGTWDPPGGNTNTYNCDPIGTACTITLTCFPRLGASLLGANVLSLTMTSDPKGQMGSTGHQEGQLVLNQGLSNADCRAGNGPGHSGGYGAAELFTYAADPKDALCVGATGGCDQVPWRPTTRASDNRMDYDGDGCSDFQELDKTGQFKCGDDPWNPYDSNATNYSGSWTILAEVAEADTGAPGAYYPCIPDIQQTGSGKTDGQIVARVYCNIDIPGIDVNGEAFPGESGDGFPGGAPPGPKVLGAANTAGCSHLAATYCNFGVYVFGDVDVKHTELTGFVDNATNEIKIRGCFEDLDGEGALGYVYVEAYFNVHNGEGAVEIWAGQASGTCTAGAAYGSYVGSPDTSGMATIFLNRNEPGPKANGERDSDQDGLSNKRELSDDCDGDPGNPFDRYDHSGAGGSPGADGVIDLSNDILGVILVYSPSGYASNPERVRFDRAPDTTTGAGHWNRYGGDGVIDLANDILGVILQYDPSGTCTRGALND
jgi:hypothetical protein